MVEYLPFNGLQVKYFIFLGVVLDLVYQVGEDLGMPVVGGVVEHGPVVPRLGYLLHQRVLLDIHYYLHLIEIPLRRRIVQFHLLRYRMLFSQNTFPSVFGDVLIVGGGS